MSDPQQPHTPTEAFDAALARARQELSRSLPDPTGFEQASARTGAAYEALEQTLAARFAYPQIPDRAAQSHRAAQARLRRVERQLSRARRWLRLRLFWRRIRLVVAWIAAGLLVLALVGAVYHYRAEIRGWVGQWLPAPPGASQPQPQLGAGGTRP